MDYLKIMVISTKDQFVKIFTDHLFYVGGVIVGYICYLTGLTTKELMSAFILILCDIASRVWAEKVNKRAILSKKMYSGFVGKIMAYAILFIAANHAFYIGEYLKYVFLSGFGLIEIRSIYENLKEAKQKHLVFFEDKILQEEKRFKEKKNEDFKK